METVHKSPYWHLVLGGLQSTAPHLVRGVYKSTLDSGGAQVGGSPYRGYPYHTSPHNQLGGIHLIWCVFSSLEEIDTCTSKFNVRCSLTWEIQSCRLTMWLSLLNHSTSFSGSGGHLPTQIVSQHRRAFASSDNFKTLEGGMGKWPRKLLWMLNATLKWSKQQVKYLRVIIWTLEICVLLSNPQRRGQ